MIRIVTARRLRDTAALIDALTDERDTALAEAERLNDALGLAEHDIDHLGDLLKRGTDGAAR